MVGEEPQGTRATWSVAAELQVVAAQPGLVALRALLTAVGVRLEGWVLPAQRAAAVRLAAVAGLEREAQLARVCPGVWPQGVQWMPQLRQVGWRQLGKSGGCGLQQPV